MKNFLRKGKITFLGYAGITFVFLLVVFASFFGNQLLQEKNNLNDFANKYKDYVNQEYDTAVSYYVSVVDGSDVTGKDNYFTYLSYALDLQQTNNYRKDNAQKAIDFYDTWTKNWMDKFNQNVSTLDVKTTKLIESSNKISDTASLETALEISKYAREIQKNYYDLYLKRQEVFEIQVNILKKMAENNGDIVTTMFQTNQEITKKSKLDDEVARINSDIVSNKGKMNDLYAALKGKNNLEDIKTKYTDSQ